MAIQFFCDCGKFLEADEAAGGESITCPSCSSSVFVPRMVGEHPEPAAFEAARPAATQPELHVTTVSDAPRDESARAADIMPTRRPTSVKAQVGFILSIVALCLVILAIPGLIVSLLALRDIRRSQGHLWGRGLALSGTIISALVIAAVPLLVYLVSHMREGAQRAESMTKLRLISLALENYHDVHKHFPPPAIYSKDGRPLLSWRVAILGYVEADMLYRGFKLDEPWDGPNNSRFLSEMPWVFRAPADESPPQGHTFYQAIVGPGAAFEPGVSLTMRDFSDGPDKTILVIEGSKAVPWTKPEDVLYDPSAPLPALGGASSRRFCFATAGATAHHFRHGALSDSTLRALITRNGKEKVELD